MKHLINKFYKKTPLTYSKRLSELYSANIYLKREDLQITRSFKIRGASNKIVNIINFPDYYNINNLNNVNFVTVSAGNHAQGVGYVCDKLGIKSTIFLPTNTPQQKINAIKKYNTNIIKVGDNFDESVKYCNDYINNNNCIFIHPFNDLDIIEGQGTIYNEIINDISPDIITCSVGGGGLLSGLLKQHYINYEYYKNLNSNHDFKHNNNFLYNNIDFIGCQPYNCASMYESIKNNKLTTLNLYNSVIDTFVDGASVKTPGNINFNIIKKYIKKLYKIKNEEVCYDLIKLYQEDGIITELAGTLPISVLRHLNKDYIKNKNIVCIVSGGNNDINRISNFICKSNKFVKNKLTII